MATGDKIVIPAQAAGFVSLFGRISKGSGSSLNLPEGMANIGGNGKGYLLASATNWDPLAHDDGSVTALAMGDDVYIYAVQDPSGIANWISSKNSTVPTGYTANNSRKIGGFHYGRVRPMTQRYTSAYSCPTGIIPNSCWDLQHRPTCDPTGMMELPNGVWLSIYLLSAGTGSWPENTLVSRYNAVPVTGTEGYMYQDYNSLLVNSGMRLPTWNEWQAGAYGVPAGATGQPGRINTGQMTGYGFDCVSCYGMDQPSGNVYQLCADKTGYGSGWVNGWASQGPDGAYSRGQVYGTFLVNLAGAYWSNAALAGGLAASLTNAPWFVTSTVGVRGACDSL